MELLSTGASRLGIALGPAQLEQFKRYYRELVDWNTRVNLTSVTGWAEVQARHFLDSLSVSLALPGSLLEAGCFVDVGSGAGFPGIPLKIAFPGLRATLIDSTAKKTAFLAGLARALGLQEVEVRTGRAEMLAHQPDLRESFDLAVSRAVADMAALVELALPFCRVGGILVAQKTPGREDEIRRAEKAAEALGGHVREVKQVTVPGLGDRSLVVVEKVRSTPERYPRRPGMPVKRPL